MIRPDESGVVVVGKLPWEGLIFIFKPLQECETKQQEEIIIEFPSKESIDNLIFGTAGKWSGFVSHSSTQKTIYLYDAPHDMAFRLIVVE